MMIQKVEMYTVICDNCGVDSNTESEYSCWSDASIARDTAFESDWQEDKDKHYCPDCYSYDDHDNLIIDESRTKPLNQTQ